MLVEESLGQPEVSGLNPAPAPSLLDLLPPAEAMCTPPPPQLCLPPPVSVTPVHPVIECTPDLPVQPQLTPATTASLVNVSTLSLLLAYCFKAVTTYNRTQIIYLMPGNNTFLTKRLFVQTSLDHVHGITFE